MSTWIILGILIFAGIILIQTLPVFAQVTETINKGMDISEDLISKTVDGNVPLNNAGKITHNGFDVLRDLYNLFRSMHRFVVSFLESVLINENDSADRAKNVATIIEIAGIIGMVVGGLTILKGVIRHVFIFIILVLFLLVGLSFANNYVNLNV